MENQFSIELQKAIKDKKVILDETEKIAFVSFDANLGFQTSDNSILNSIRWNFGIRAELLDKGFLIL